MESRTRISREVAERLVEQQQRDGIWEQGLAVVVAANAVGGSGGPFGGEVQSSSCARIPVVDAVRLLCQVCVDAQAAHRPPAECKVEENSRLCLNCIR